VKKDDYLEQDAS